MYRQNTCNIGTAILLSIIIGIGVAVLFSLGLLTLIYVGLWIALGLSTVTLFIFTILLSVLSINPFACFKKAARIFGRGIIIGSIGTIVTSLAALSIILLPFITAAVILIFLVAFFLTLMIVSLIQFLFFLINQDICCN